MTSIDSLPGIATMGHPQILHGPHRVGITADSFGRPSGKSWRGRVDGPSSTRRRPGRYGWSAECRAMTEIQLLECFVATNDSDAFRVLVERHGPMVLAVCRNVLRGQHDVEDAFRDTFLALARGPHTFKQSSTIGPWLHRVALRRAKEVLTQERIGAARAIARLDAADAPPRPSAPETIASDSADGTPCPGLSPPSYPTIRIRILR